MAFLGNPIIETVADDLVRITGVRVAKQATGKIGLAQSTQAPDILLPEDFKPRFYTRPDGTLVPLAASIQVWWQYISPGNGFVFIALGKVGVTKETFEISLANLEDAMGNDSPGLEIYIGHR